MSLETLVEPVPYLVDNPNLLGGFAPVDKELVVDQFEIIGRVPEDLNGMYVRNGPVPRFAPEGKYHWYDGDGMLQAVRFERGHVQFRNRWVRTEGWYKEDAVGRNLYAGLKARMPDGKLPDDAMKNTSNTDVKFHNGKLLSMWYRGGAIYLNDPLTLETLGTLTPDPRLAGLQISAHSRIDERTGEFIFFAYGNRHPYMHYGVIGADGELKTFMPVELPGARLPHDMGITENYSILHDFPLVNNAEALKVGRYSLEFHPEWPSRFAIIPRNGSVEQIRWFEASARYMLHVVNAWEEVNAQGQTEVVMLGTPYAMPKQLDGSLDVKRLLFTIGTQSMDQELYQWRFNLDTGETREGVVDDVFNTEFPMINARYQGYKNRYCYNVLMGKMRTVEQPRFSGLVKYDLQTGSSVAYNPGEGFWFSEAPYAERDNASAEDDGYIVGFVWNGQEERSEVWVLDAQKLADGPLARIILPQRVPHGFHGTWVRDAQLQGLE
ncbi:apocarotenoid-15,15'-oxygenase [Pseudomonas lactis]|uniref:Apocarotenoid-15,15'-oxygenase n=1 Tax=Pseudomonas lactis TaxID=1615674 RepID=A0A7Y1M788_9PSED|nr:carotenoid oxygenase family protein [Pseudomonas lactis]NNA76493.1 apocarotenoid-15,15'-oxygenase [Pseudomonas lactis]